MIYVIKAIRGVLGVVAMLGLLIGTMMVIFAIGFGRGYAKEELALFALVSCAMIAVALLIMFSGVFGKLDDAESRLEKKEREKRASQRRDVSGGGSFGDSSISYSEKDSEYQEDWIEFHQRHDDLDRMEAITAKYGPDWTGVDVERPFGDEDPEQPAGNFVDYE